MARDDDRADQVRGLLRAVEFPGTRRDIVAAGFIKDIEVRGKRVTVHFAPDTRNPAKVERMQADILGALRACAQFEDVAIERHAPYGDLDVLRAGGEAAPGAEAGAPGARNMQRPDMAPGAGYDEDGPAPLGGPRSEVYEGELAVLQWEIDPQDSSARSGTADLAIGEWEYRVWWQVHPAGLVYASIQAMREDWAAHEGAARAHPVGRSEAVNLVYDIGRKAVVAIYGTVRDFRPFVDAFNRGYVLKN